MSVSVRTRWGAVSLLCLGLSMAASSRIAATRALPGAGARGPESGGLLVEMSRRPGFTLGFRNALADLVWLEAVQVAGNKRMKGADYDRLAVLLDAVANYDPRFAVPYIIGALALSESPEHSRDAVRILERGRRHHAADWRFPFYVGFTQYFALGNAAEGGRAMAAAAKLPGSPGYLASLASRMLAEGREPETALALLREMERHETDEAKRAILARRYLDVTVERDVQLLERAAGEFRARSGRAPVDLAELVRAGVLERLPAEPNGGSYVLRPDGTIRSDRAPDRFGVFKKR